LRGHLDADVAKQAGGAMVLTTPHAEITVIGTRFTVDVDGVATRVKMVTGRVRVRCLLGGAPVELAALESARIDDRIVVTREPKKTGEAVLFADDFDGAPVGLWPQGWQRHFTDAERRSCFRVLKEALDPSDQYMGYRSCGYSLTQHAYVPLRNWPRRMRITFSMRLTGPECRRAGMELTAYDLLYGISLEYVADSERLVAKGRLSGAWRETRAVPLVLAHNKWHDIYITIDDSRVLFSVEQGAELDFMAEHLHPVETVCLIGQGADSVDFDNIRVEALPPQPLAARP